MAWVLAKHGFAFGKTQLWPTQHYITSCKTFEALATGRHKGNDPSAKSKFDFFRKKDFFVIENLEEADQTKKMKKSLSGNLNLGQKVRRSVIGGLASQKKIQIWPWQPSPQLNTFKEKSFALHCSSCAPNSCRRVPNSTESIGFG